MRDARRPALWRVGVLLKGLAGAGAVLGLIVGIATGVWVWRLADEIPDSWELSRATNAQPSVVLAANGERLTQFEPAFREWVPLDSIPVPLLDALLATEDRRFYAHGGVDVRRTVAAVWNTVRGRREGGSTVTQQLARNLFPDEIGNAGTVERKAKEAIAAVQIERGHTKREILEAYLNTVPLLYNANGVELGARTYFGTTAPRLTLPQAAVLVAMLKGPNEYNPVRFPERSRARRDLVFRRMAAVGAIDSTAADSLSALPLGVTLTPQPGTYSRAPHFTAAVRRTMDAWASAHGYDVERDGLVIRTTLDLDVQAAAEAAVAERAERLQRTADREWRRGPPRAALDAALKRTGAYARARADGQNEASALETARADEAAVDSARTAATRVEAALVALDPNTGAVRAYVGSRDHAVDEYDHAGVARRQPGSTFKAFVYAAALQRGYAPTDEVAGGAFTATVEGGGTWTPSGGRSEGTLAEALAYSKNSAAARLTEEVGPHRVALVAKRMGVVSPLDVVPSIGLGTSETTLLEMVGAYGTIANDGVHRTPTLISRIETADGRVLESVSAPRAQALTRRDARTLFDMMRGVVDRGTARDLRALGATGDLAGKTGTTQKHADGWFIGMRPGLVAGAWVGFNDRRVTYRSMETGSGSKTALPIVAAFFRRVQDALPDGLALPRPPGYGEAMLVREEAPDTLAIDDLLQDAAVADPARDLYEGVDFDTPPPEPERPATETPDLRPLPGAEPEPQAPPGRIGW